MEQAQNIPTQNYVVQINAQYIKDLSFECPDPLKAFQEHDVEINFDVGMEINTQQVGDDIFEVVLKIQVKALRQTAISYICELQYAGIITLKNVPEDQRQYYLMIECPKHIFPFARQIISQVTTESGFQPYLMQLLDFTSLYQQQENAPTQAN